MDVQDKEHPTAEHQPQRPPGTSGNWSKVDQAMQLATRPYVPGPQAEGDSPKGPDAAQSTDAEVKSFLKSRIGGGKPVAPGAVVLVGRGREVLYHKSFGCRSLRPETSPAKPDTVYDLGDVTKSVATATLAMQLVQRGHLDLDRRLSHVFQTFGSHGKERMTARHLLNHTSGYPATTAFYRQIVRADSGERAGFMASRGAIDYIYNELFRSRLENLPGKVTKFSDLGYMLLGRAMEVLSGTPFEKMAQRGIFKPLGLTSTGFIDFNLLRRHGVEPDLTRIAPTGTCPWRGRTLCGEVHEDNAWAMGGVAPHAGLFSNAIDLHRYSSELIDCWHGRSSFIDRAVLKKFWETGDSGSSRPAADSDAAVRSAGSVSAGSVSAGPVSAGSDGGWALGWSTPKTAGANAGSAFSDSAVGINSYTGCALWIDPEREVTIVLLSNTVHLNGATGLMQSFRPVLFDLINETVDQIGRDGGAAGDFSVENDGAAAGRSA